MFGFLKDKIKSVVSRFSQKVEEESKVEEKVEEIKEELKIKEEPEKIKVKPEKKHKKEVKKEKKKELKHKEKAKHKEDVLEEVKEKIELDEIKSEEPMKELEIKQEVNIDSEKKEIEIKIEEEFKEPKKGFFSKLKEKFISKTEEPEEEFKPAEVKYEREEPKIRESLKVEPIQIEEKKGFFDSIKEKITTTKISGEKFNELFDELELTMLENNVALEVVDKIREDLSKSLIDKPIKRSAVEDTIKSSLKESIEDLFLVNKFDLIQKINESNKKPYVICFLGQNGSGKTTSISKVANYLKNNNKSVVLAAADTFRAASIEQIKEWGSRLNVKVIAHDYGSDPAAVCFDSIKYAQSHNIDVVLIDTAGRQHSNKNLMQEMEKIIRIAKPDLKIFVGESITGNDALEQSQDFNKSVGIDGVILTKADIDEKGGTIISISYITHRPIIFLGVGQNLDDLKEFNKDEILEKIGLV